MNKNIPLQCHIGVFIGKFTSIYKAKYAKMWSYNFTAKNVILCNQHFIILTFLGGPNSNYISWDLQ